jgi:glycosyltransferase involved in cell wall biosynthesis
MEKKLVSVIVPYYNHRLFIEECLASIYAQTYSYYEVIVIDDGSTDQSQELLEALQKKYSFTLIIQKNRGLSGTLNRGFKEIAKGEYLTSCSSDDFWYPNKLEDQVSFLNSHPNIPMVYGMVTIVDEQSKVLEAETRSANAQLKGGRIFKEILLQEFHPPVNYMFTRWILEKVDYYPQNVWAEDFEMNCKIALDFEIGYIPKPLFYYRRGVASKQKMLTFNTVNSHYCTINKYHYSEYFQEALKCWHYRNFIWYAGYREAKWFAIKNLFYSWKEVIKGRNWKSILYLFLKYK